MEEGALSQGVWAALGAGKDEGKGFFPESPQERSTAAPLGFGPWCGQTSDLVSRQWAGRLLF